jgi:uncharacterized Zn finger protein
MKLINKKNQNRRDLDIDVECESCGNKEEICGAYDDRNYWDNVLPTFKCKKCGKSTNDLGLEVRKVATRYGDYEVV